MVVGITSSQSISIGIAAAPPRSAAEGEEIGVLARGGGGGNRRDGRRKGKGKNFGLGGGGCVAARLINHQEQLYTSRFWFEIFGFN